MNIFPILLPEDTFIQVAIATIHLSFLGQRDIYIYIAGRQGQGKDREAKG